MAKTHAALKWTDAISGCPVSTKVRWGEKITCVLITHVFQITERQICEIFWDSVYYVILFYFSNLSFVICKLFYCCFYCYKIYLYMHNLWGLVALMLLINACPYSEYNESMFAVFKMNLVLWLKMLQWSKWRHRKTSFVAHPHLYEVKIMRTLCQQWECTWLSATPVATDEWMSKVPETDLQIAYTSYVRLIPDYRKVNHTMSQW